MDKISELLLAALGIIGGSVAWAIRRLFKSADKAHARINILEKRLQALNKSTVVFTYHNQPINQQFISHKTKKLVRLSKINPRLNFHSLRHTFASWLVQKGVSIYEVSKLLGHADIKTTQIYAHLRSDDLRSAVLKLD